MAHLASRSARRSPARRLLPALALVLALAGTGVAGACAGNSAPVLSGEAGRGQKIARDKGCTSCHTTTGNKSEGPTWKGLAGSTVTLADGTTVVADDAYLTRAITDPRAQQVQGYRMAMPVTPMPEADVAALVAYIKELK